VIDRTVIHPSSELRISNQIHRYYQFSSSYHDLRVTLRRYGHCIGELPPLRDSSLNETEYLVQQMRVFLDQANYDNEQLANVSALMDNICRSDLDSSYPISVNIDVTKYNNNGTGKENRCKAIDEALDSMFVVFKRASVNKSEPLDFSVIQFYPNASNKAASYNLTDLINTSWIKSETILEHVCKITDSVKDYVQARMSNSKAQDRSQQQQGGYFSTLLDIINNILEPLLGFQKRLYWEGNNMLESGYSRISYGLGSLRSGIGNRYKNTRDRISNLFSSSQSANSTLALNSTSPQRTTSQSLAGLNKTISSR